MNAVRQILLLSLLLFLAGGIRAESGIFQQKAVEADFQSVHEALVEAIEAEGLVISTTVSFNDMLERTAKDIGKGRPPYVRAEIVQFCTTRIAWKLVEEAPENLALCPVSIAVYATVAAPEQIIVAYRSPGQASQARKELDTLMRKIVTRAIALARQR